MQITKEMLQQRLATLQQERAQAVSAVSAYDGAIQQVAWDMERLLIVEPVAPVAEAPAVEEQANG